MSDVLTKAERGVVKLLRRESSLTPNEQDAALAIIDRLAAVVERQGQALETISKVVVDEGCACCLHPDDMPSPCLCPMCRIDDALLTRPTPPPAKEHEQ